MLQYLDVALAFAAFLGFCVFFNRRCRMPGGRTPLLTVAIVLLWLTVFGVLGALRLGGWLLYLAGTALWALAFWPRLAPRLSRIVTLHGKKAPAAPRGPSPLAAGRHPVLFDPGFALFLALCLATTLVFAVRKPLFAEWDELSFWGTACKLVKLNDTLYTTAAVGWDWVGAQQPGAILVSYFFQFFGAFAPWKTFVGYDVLLYAAFATVLSALTGTRAGDVWRDYPLAVAGGLLCVLSPFLLTEYCRILEVTNTYMSAYGDIPAGIVAGGAAAWYFAARATSDGPLAEGATGDGGPERICAGGLWGVFPILAAAGLIKENAFPVALVAAGLVAADTLFCRRGPRFAWRAVFAAGALAAPLAAYLVWSRHIAALVALRESAGEVGSTNLSVVQVVVLGFRQLLFPAERTPVFLQVTRDMLDAFVGTRLSLLGSFSAKVLGRLCGADSALARLPGTGAWVAACCLGLFCLAALLCKDRRRRRSTLWAAALSTLGFVGYYWVLILSYAFIFKPGQAAILTDYNRYVDTYYLFWSLLALGHLLCAASADGRRRPLTGCALACAALGLATTAWSIRPQMTALEYPETTFAAQQVYAQTAAEVTAQVQAAGLPGSIFFVSTQDNGLRYFNYCYQLLPLQMDFSFGGGPLGSAENNTGSIYYHALSCAELEAYLQERGCDYIFLESYDDIFCQEYAPLFADGLAAAAAGARLYVREVGADALRYLPVGGDA